MENKNTEKEKPLFTVRENKCVGFDSQWKVKKVTMHASSQTNVVTHAENTTNTSETQSTRIQTDEIPVPIKPEYNEERLAEFLRKLYPRVSKELNDAATSQVFKNYHSMQRSGGRAESAKLFDCFKVLKDSGDYNVSISSLSWNSTGNKIAVATTQEHDSWCHHQGTVQIYTLQGSHILFENSLIMKASNCVTAVKFHPFMAPILVAGTYAGEIVIWNTQNDNKDTVLIRVMAHNETVTQVSWISDLDSTKNILLASGSLDGFLNLWDFNINDVDLKIKERYKVKAPMFGRLQRKAELPARVSAQVDRGIVAFDFSQFTPEMFVVAAEGGFVAQCSRLRAKVLQEATSTDVSIMDPVFQYYRSHEGEITSIFLSTERQDLFVTNGTEGELHLYTFGEEEPGRIIFTQSPTLFTIWVPYSQNMLAACGSKGSIQFYNSKNGKLLKDMQGAGEVTLTCMEFHRAKISLVAIGAKDGSMQSWEVPWNSF